MLLDNSCQLARLMVTSPAARGTRLTQNVFLRHRSRRRIDLMNSQVRLTIAVRRNVPTAAAIALNSFHPRCSPMIRQRSSITTSHNSVEAVPPVGGLLLHHLETSVASLPRSVIAGQKWLTPAGLDQAERGHPQDLAVSLRQSN